MIDEETLRNDTTRVYAMMFVFARGVSRFAGGLPSPILAAKAGMTEVFQWWCTHGYKGTRPDIREMAADVAEEIAEHLGFDEKVIDAAMFEANAEWSAYSCPHGIKRRWSGYAEAPVSRRVHLALPSAGHLRALPPPQ
jgi:hypothetical protein